MAIKKERLDVHLTDLGYFPSREKAKRAIMAGLVFVDGDRVDKAGTKIKVESEIEVKGKALKYVGRGGLKMEKAMEAFDIDVNDKIGMDIGASTGGFTDCMLQNGATKVFAIDVGYGQLDWKLRNDPRVVCMERTNARLLTFDMIGEFVDFISIDVSFISLKLILGPAMELLKPEGEIVALIKPQFEAGRDKVGKKGVVRDIEVHRDVVRMIYDFCIKNNLYFKDLEYSPIKGAEGNIEYLAHITKQPNDVDFESLLDEIVNQSHEKL